MEEGTRPYFRQRTKIIKEGVPTDSWRRITVARMAADIARTGAQARGPSPLALRAAYALAIGLLIATVYSPDTTPNPASHEPPASAVPNLAADTSPKPNTTQNPPVAKRGKIPPYQPTQTSAQSLRKEPPLRYNGKRHKS